MKNKKEINCKKIFCQIKQAIGNVETIKIAAENEQSYGTLNDDSSLKNQQKKEIVHPDQIIPRVNGNSSFDFSSPTSVSNKAATLNKVEIFEEANNFSKDASGHRMRRPTGYP